MSSSCERDLRTSQVLEWKSVTWMLMAEVSVGKARTRKRKGPSSAVSGKPGHSAVSSPNIGSISSNPIRYFNSTKPNQNFRVLYLWEYVQREVSPETEIDASKKQGQSNWVLRRRVLTSYTLGDPASYYHWHIGGKFL